MEVKNSYLVKLVNEKQAWLSVNTGVPDDAIIIEKRPMLIPAEGMVLHKVNTEEYSCGVWLKDSTIEDWEEITQEQYELIVEDEQDIVEE